MGRLEKDEEGRRWLGVAGLLSVGQWPPVVHQDLRRCNRIAPSPWGINSCPRVEPLHTLCSSCRFLQLLVGPARALLETRERLGPWVGL